VVPIKRKKVLYVEDNPVNILLVKAILEARPHVQLLTATYGRIGLTLAREHRPDLILLDLNLPDMSGEEYLHQLRANEAIADIPVLIVSGDAPPENFTTFLQLGVVDYLSKPFSLNEFEELVDRYLGIAVNPRKE
jgi:CheY-like chemotaxis protein